MTVNPANLTAQQRQDILQHINDVAHEKLANSENIFLATQCKDDPRKFTIVADGYYDKKLEEVKVIFDDAEDFKRIFPEFTTTLPPPADPHKDPYKITNVYSQPRNLPAEYNPRNVLDGNPNTRVAYKGDLFIVLDAGQPIDVSTVWVQWLDGDQRQAKFTLGVSLDNVNSLALVPGFENVYSSGKSTEFESYNLSPNPDVITKARYFLVKVSGNTKNNWSTILNIKLTKARALTSMQTTEVLKPTTEPEPEPEEPDKPTTEPDKPTEPTEPPITDGDNTLPMPAEKRVYNPDIAAKNKGRKLTGKLPLIERLDPNGMKYTDLRKLTEMLGYGHLIKSYKYDSENLKPKENNNSGDENGKSLRLDMKSYMPECEYTVKLLNRSNVNEQISLKYGGTHSGGSDDIWADCLIVRLHMNGTTVDSQLEPRHMAPDPFGYGKKFNVVNNITVVGNTKGKFNHYRFIKLNDIPNNRVIVVLAVDKTGSGNDFDLVYESTIHDGMGGERVLKDPFAQWAYHVKKDLSKCNITIRMDGQGNNTLKKGDNYDKPRCTEIVNG